MHNYLLSFNNFNKFNKIEIYNNCFSSFNLTRTFINLSIFRQENLLLQVRISHLEHRSKELLLQQGAAISSASVALSSLSTRFDLLLEQLTNAYNINDADLEVFKLFVLLS